jgi:hypothetical protein
MTRALVLIGVIAALLTFCSSGFGAVSTIESPAGALAAQWNLFAIPNIPLDPSPPAVLSQWDPGDGSVLDVRYFYRLDAATQTMIPYFMHDPDTFGNMLIGDGYWIKLEPTDSAVIQYSGMTDNDSTDMWISLPEAGWTLIGHPYGYPRDLAASEQNPFLWSGVEVTDGTVTKTMQQAADAGWITSQAYWVDSPTQSMYTVGLPTDYPATESLIAWHGYWVQSFVDNLALILTANPPPP